MNKLSKVLISSALTGLLLLSATPSLGAEYDYGTVRATSLNVRSDSDINSSIIGALPSEATVKIIGFENECWYEISYNGGIGFVHADYIIDVRTIDESEVNEYVADSTKGMAVVNTAKQYLGIPYVYGGMSPSGFDCSGFTKYVYAQYGVNLNRTAAGQASDGYAVSRSQLQPGDLVFFATAGGNNISHTSIYVGNGQVIHSPRTGKSIEIVDLNSDYYSSRYVCARRIF